MQAQRYSPLLPILWRYDCVISSFIEIVECYQLIKRESYKHWVVWIWLTAEGLDSCSPILLQSLDLSPQFELYCKRNSPLATPPQPGMLGNVVRSKVAYTRSDRRTCSFQLCAPYTHRHGSRWTCRVRWVPPPWQSVSWSRTDPAPAWGTAALVLGHKYRAKNQAVTTGSATNTGAKTQTESHTQLKYSLWNFLKWINPWSRMILEQTEQSAISSPQMDPKTLPFLIIWVRQANTFTYVSYVGKNHCWLKSVYTTCPFRID